MSNEIERLRAERDALKAQLAEVHKLACCLTDELLDASASENRLRAERDEARTRVYGLQAERDALASALEAHEQLAHDLRVEMAQMMTNNAERVRLERAVVEAARRAAKTIDQRVTPEHYWIGDTEAEGMRAALAALDAHERKEQAE